MMSSEGPLIESTIESIQAEERLQGITDDALTQFHQLTAEEANQQVVLMLPDAGEIPGQMQPLCELYPDCDVIEMAWPYHGTENDTEALLAFDVDAALEKGLELYNSLSEIYHDIHIVGAGLGGVAALDIAMRAAKPAKSLVTLYPYLVGYTSDELLLSYANGLDKLNCSHRGPKQSGLVDWSIREFFGHKTHLSCSPRTFEYPSETRGPVYVPLAFLRKESRLRQKTLARNRSIPSETAVALILNKRDPYTNNNKVEPALRQCLGSSILNAYTFTSASKAHSVVAEIAADEGCQEIISATLQGLEHILEHDTAQQSSWLSSCFGSASPGYHAMKTKGA